MSDPGGTSPGELGGIVAGIVAVLGTIGGGIAWMVRWLERRGDRRTAKLDAWHAELKAREADQLRREAEWDARMEGRVAELEGQLRAVRLAFELVAVPLRTLDPAHPNLAQAEKLLEAAFPLIPVVPGNMASALGAID